MEYAVGDKIITSGYEGRVIAIVDADLIEVRLESGDKCVDKCDVKSVKE